MGADGGFESSNAMLRGRKLADYCQESPSRENAE